MKQLSELISSEKTRIENKDAARHFRESLINQFIEEINKSRIGTTFSPVNKRGIAVKINGNPFLKESWQLESFLKKCKESKSGFSRCFFGSLKIK